MYTCRPEYFHASVLCHIHSTTNWTLEVKQTSYLHDVYSFFSSISYTTRWHVTKRWAHPLTVSLPINNQNTTDYKFVWGFCFYVDYREFFWLQHTLFSTGRSRPPDLKGTTSSFLSGPNFTCLRRVHPWTHTGQYTVIAPHVRHRKWHLTPSCTVQNTDRGTA